MGETYIISTNYFNKPWTWLKKLIHFLGALGFLFWIQSMEAGEHATGYSWIKYALFVMLTSYIIVKPKDELAVDNENLYYIRKSIIPSFTRTTKYQISKIKSIGCGGVYDTDTEFLIKGNSYSNRLEIVFQDNSSTSEDVAIYKSELKAIVEVVQSLIKRYYGPQSTK